MKTREEMLQRILKTWEQIDEKDDILIFRRITKFNSHPDSPNLHHYGFLNNDGMWGNNVCFELDDYLNFYKMIFLWEYKIKVTAQRDWNKNISKLKDKNVIL